MQAVVRAKPLRANAKRMIPQIASRRYDEAFRRLERQVPRWVWMLPQRYWQPILKRCAEAAQRISLKRLDRLRDRWL